MYLWIFRKNSAFLITVLSLFIVHQSAHAAAFQLYELGTPIIGSGGVGQAVVDDASTSYFNPAGMAYLPTTEYMLGSQILLPYNYFSANRFNTIRGNNGGGNVGTLTPGMDLYFAYHYSPCLQFGVSLTSPYGGSLNYNDGWVGRFVVQDALFYTINLNPSVAYRLTDWFSLGAGLAVEYMNLEQTTALPLPISPLIDGQIDFKVHNTNVGFNLGMMLSPTPCSKIGLAYRSRITHNLHGHLTFLRIPQTPNTSIKMIMPQNLILSASQRFADRFTLYGEAGWSNWSVMKNTVLRVEQFSAVTVLNWKNTYRLGLAAAFQVFPCLQLHGGVSYDSSPTKTSLREPDLPMDKQYRIGAGFVYSMIHAFDVAFSYEYWNLGKAEIHNVSSNGVLAGSYPRNFINVIQASINVKI